MLMETKTNIRDHRPVEVRRRDAAKLLQALKLKNYRDKLHSRIDGTGGPDVSLTGVETFLQQLVERNRKAIVRTDRQLIEVVYIDFVVVVVMHVLLRNQMLQRVILHDI